MAEDTDVSDWRSRHASYLESAAAVAATYSYFLELDLGKQVLLYCLRLFPFKILHIVFK